MSISTKKQEYMREWRCKNKDRINEYRRVYRNLHRDQHNASSNKWYTANKERALKDMRRRWLMNAHGLTLIQYEEMLKNQNRVCLICHKVNRYKNAGKRLAVDHSHKTGKIRGLLCNRCNLCLGWYEDNQDIVMEYLKRGYSNESV